MILNFVHKIWVFGLLLGSSVNFSESLSGKDAVERFFKYFKTEDPVGIPVVDIKEPMAIFSPLETIPITLTNGKVFGSSKIKILQIFVDFLTLKGSAKMFAPYIELFGNYSWPGFLFTSSGFMSASMLNVSGASNFTMYIDQEDNLQLTDIQISQTNEGVSLNLTEMLWEHELLLSTGAIHIFFDDIVIEVFRQLRPFLITEVNEEVLRFLATLPRVENLLSTDDAPLETPSGEIPESKTFETIMKRMIQYLGMEPLKLPERRTKVIGVRFKISDIVLSGVSTVSKIDKMYFVYQEKMIYLEVSMRYPKLLLSYKVEMESKKVMDFDVHQNNQLNEVDVRMRFVIDPSQKTQPRITYFDINIESFGKIRERKKKSFWRRVLGVLSKFENMIRREIVNAMQGLVKKILQKELNNVNLEEDLIWLLEKSKN